MQNSERRLFEGILPSRQLTLLFGEKIGKTELGMQLCHSINLSIPFLGKKRLITESSDFFTKPYNAFFFAPLKNVFFTTQQALLGAAKLAVSDSFKGFTLFETDIKKIDLKKIHETLSVFHVELIVFDNYSYLPNAMFKNPEKDEPIFLEKLQCLAESHDCAVLIIYKTIENFDETNCYEKFVKQFQNVWRIRKNKEDVSCFLEILKDSGISSKKIVAEIFLKDGVFSTVIPPLPTWKNFLKRLKKDKNVEI